METISGVDMIDIEDRFKNRILHVTKDGYSFIMKKDGSFTLKKDMHVALLHGAHRRSPDILFVGETIIDECSLAGGGKTYITETRFSKRVFKFDYDHLGNLLIREAATGIWGTPGRKLEYRFANPRILLDKFEVNHLKRKRKKFFKERRKPYDQSEFNAYSK